MSYSSVYLQKGSIMDYELTLFDRIEVIKTTNNKYDLERLGCIITDSRTKKVIKFHPLIKVNEEWENEFIEHKNVRLCDLYYPPFNFKRTV